MRAGVHVNCGLGDDAATLHRQFMMTAFPLRSVALRGKGLGFIPFCAPMSFHLLFRRKKQQQHFLLFFFSFVLWLRAHLWERSKFYVLCCVYPWSNSIYSTSICGLVSFASPLQDRPRDAGRTHIPHTILCRVVGLVSLVK